MILKNLLNYLLIILLTGSLNIKSLYAQTNEPSDKYNALTDLWGIGLKATTFGAGGELIKGFGKLVDIRVGYSSMKLNMSYDVEMEDIELELNGQLKTGGAHLFVNVNPVRWFHTTVGVVKNGTSILITANRTDGLPIEDLLVPPEEVGEFDVMLTPAHVFSPYVGIGFGSTLNRKKRIGFSVDFGAIYHAKPEAMLWGYGMIGPTANAENLDLIEKLISPYRWWPVVNIELSIRFL